MKRRRVFEPFAVKAALYLLGFLITGAGVVMLLRTQHAGPWDAVSYNLHRFVRSFFWAGYTVGMGSFTINGLIMLMVVLARKKWRFLFMVVPIGGISLSIDLWNVIIPLARLQELGIMGTSLLYVAGTFVLTLGLATIVVSGYPAMVFEEMMLLLMDVFKIHSVFAVRLGMELFAILLAILLGTLAGVGFGAVGLGSLLLALLIAPILDLQLRWMKGVIYETNNEKTA